MLGSACDGSSTSILPCPALATAQAMGLHSYSYSSYPPAGTYSRDRIYATTPIVERSPFVPRNIRFDDSNFTCATLLHTDINRLLPSTFPPPLRAKHTSPAFSIRTAVHKGLGIFARRPLAAGTIIFTEHPLLVAAKTSGDISGLLGPKELVQLKMLANSKRYEFAKDTEGIMQTNAVEVQLPATSGTVDHYAVFLNLSRCNHSCSPNAHWTWDPKTFSVILEAVRPISKGEEINIQYIDSCISYGQRREKLASRFGFDCLCPTCTEPDHEQSNTARSNLRSVVKRMPTFEEWCYSSDLPDDHLITMATKALEIRESEGLQLFEARRHMEVIAMCYGALADAEMFKAWVQKWLDLWKGRPMEDRLVMELWLEDPTRFYVWGWHARVQG